MFNTVKKILFKDQISSFIRESKKVVLDKKMVMSYLIEPEEIIFFFILSNTILLMKKHKNKSLEIKTIQFDEIYLQDLTTIKAIKESQYKGETVDSISTIYFLFNFISNIKDQFNINIFEQRQIIEAILDSSEFFESNTTVSLPTERYNWVD